jgi:hypothetical protein
MILTPSPMLSASGLKDLTFMLTREARASQVLSDHHYLQFAYGSK